MMRPLLIPLAAAALFGVYVWLCRRTARTERATGDTVFVVSVSPRVASTISPPLTRPERRDTRSGDAPAPSTARSQGVGP